MSAVRVSFLQQKCSEKNLKVYFSKPEHGGGPIKNIYFPLFNNSAVIEFINENVAEMVVAHYQTEENNSLNVQALPNMIYGKMIADVDPEVCSCLQACEELRDDIQYNGDLEYIIDKKKNIVGIRGTWYQLEWVWAKIHEFMQQQSFIQKRVARSNMVRQQVQEQGQPKGKGRKGLQQTTLLERQRIAEEKPIERQTSKEKAGKSVVGMEATPQHRSNAPMDQEPEISGQYQSPAHGLPEMRSGATGHDDSFSRYRDQQSFHSDSDSDEKQGLTRGAQSTGNSQSKAVAKKKHGDPKTKTSSSEGKSRHKYEFDETDTEDELYEVKSADRRHIKVTAEIYDVSDAGKPNPKPAQLPGAGDVKSSGQGIQIVNDNPDDVKSLTFTYGPLTVDVYVGWITMEETDAIVNAAMGPLIHAGGVARAIAVAAGPELERQCEEYVKINGSVQTTEVMHSCAGGSLHENVKHVIHAVGPIWPKEARQADGVNCLTELTNTFLNAFLYGNNVLKITSIAVPLISSGIFGCPLELCVRSFLSAVLLFHTKFSASDSGDVVLRRINLVNNDEGNTANTVVTLRELIEGGPEPILAWAYQLQQQYDASATRNARTTALPKSSGSKLKMESGMSSQQGGLSSQGVDRLPHDMGISFNPKPTSKGVGDASMASHGATSCDIPSSRQPLTSGARMTSQSGSSGNTKKKGPPTKSYLSVSQQMGLKGSGSQGEMMSSQYRHNPSVDVSGVPDYGSPLTSYPYGTTAGRAQPPVPNMSSTPHGIKPRKK